ncbi:hypothetical protein LM595_05335 [Candidatus Acetothermia bacterium]|nr:hypothetical protein [Candidatus Acetothermia bacterium]
MYHRYLTSDKIEGVIKMNRLFKITLIIAIVVIGFTTASIAQRPRLAIYTAGIAVVQETRLIHFDAGISQFVLYDIPVNLIPGSLYIQLSAGEVIEQEFRFTQPEQIITHFIGSEIEVLSFQGELYRGTLLAAVHDRVILIDGAGMITIITMPVRITLLTGVPVYLQPALYLTVNQEIAGQQRVSLFYLTRGMSWSADYIAILNETADRLSLQGWINLTNNSGRNFIDTCVKVLAGDINLIGLPRHELRAVVALNEDKVAPHLVPEKAVAFYLYSLPRRIDLLDGRSIAVPFTSADRVPVEKIYLFDSAVQPGVQIRFRFVNHADSGLGEPLPTGIFRLFQRRADGTVLLLGEDWIDHTPRNEQIEVSIGIAFDLIGERVHTQRQQVNETLIRDTFSITLRNHQEKAVTIEVIERIRGIWRIIDASLAYGKIDAHTIRFIVELAPGEEKEIFYTVEFSL